MKQFIVTVAVVAGMGFSAYAAPVTTATTATSPASTVSVSAAQVAPTKKVTLNYTAENAAQMRAANTDKPGVLESQQHIGAKYAFDADRTLQVRQYFFYNATDKARTNEWAIGDTAFHYADKKATTIGNAPILGAARLYVPVSEASRDTGKYELRLYGSVERDLGNGFNLEAIVNPRIYGYTENQDAQKGFRILPAISVEKNLAGGVSPFVGGYTDHTWFHDGSVGTGKAKKDPAANKDLFVSSIGVGYSPIKALNIKFYVETEDDLSDNKNFVLFDDQTSTYYLDIGVTL
jgi:hypothetical protein